jgi:hypothetical protein
MPRPKHQLMMCIVLVGFILAYAEVAKAKTITQWGHPSCLSNLEDLNDRSSFILLLGSAQLIGVDDVVMALKGQLRNSGVAPDHLLSDYHQIEVVRNKTADDLLVEVLYMMPFPLMDSRVSPTPNAPKMSELVRPYQDLVLSEDYIYRLWSENAGEEDYLENIVDSSSCGTLRSKQTIGELDFTTIEILSGDDRGAFHIHLVSFSEVSVPAHLGKGQYSTRIDWTRSHAQALANTLRAIVGQFPH